MIEQDGRLNNRPTSKALEASVKTRKVNAARRHAQQWTEGLELLGYTVIPPGDASEAQTP
jgi:hypothetical protein